MSRNGHRAEKVRLLHTSDLHLGREPSPENLTVAERLLGAIGAVVDEEQVDLAIIAGDFFEHNRVSQDLSQLVARKLGEMQAPVLILPGNHDCFEGESVYRRPHFQEGPSHMHVVQPAPEGRSLSFPDLDLAIWSRAHSSYVENFEPFASLPPRGQERWQVAVGHGHFVRAPHDQARSYPIHLSQLRESARDYIALGHWDIFTPVLEGEVNAYYSGSPHFTGHVTLVDLDPTLGVRVFTHSLPR